MSVLDAAYWIACVTLILSGISKLRFPTATEATLTALSLPAPNGAARMIASLELLVGMAGLVTSARLAAAAVAVLYLGFTWVVLAARRAGLADCGCIGIRVSPPTLRHALINLSCAAVAAGAAVATPSSALETLQDLGTPAMLAVAGAMAVLSGVLVSIL